MSRKKSKQRSFNIGDYVYTRNYGCGNYAWSSKPMVIWPYYTRGAVIFLIDLTDERTVRPYS